MPNQRPCVSWEVLQGSRGAGDRAVLTLQGQSAWWPQGLRGKAEGQSVLSLGGGVTCPFVPQFLAVVQILASWTQAAGFKW